MLTHHLCKGSVSRRGHILKTGEGEEGKELDGDPGFEDGEGRGRMTEDPQDPAWVAERGPIMTVIADIH